MITNHLYMCVVLGFLDLQTAVKVTPNDILLEFQSHPNWKLLDRGEDCGLSSSDRIIGGVKASLGQFPWITHLGYRYGGPDGQVLYKCGGSIISDRYILTAAHCALLEVGSPLPLVQVRLGEYDVNSDPDCLDGVCAPPVQDIDVEQAICHPDFYSYTLRHDICLLRLAAPIQFNRFVYPICLPAFGFFQSNLFNGTVMEVAGWGYTDIETREMSDVLLTLKVPVVDHSHCVSEYLEKRPIEDTQMCAGGVVGKDSCAGDSGGPLMSSVSLDAPPRYFAVGIVSFGPNKCADSNTPGVYTNVFQHMKWILDSVKK